VKCLLLLDLHLSLRLLAGLGLSVKIRYLVELIDESHGRVAEGRRQERGVLQLRDGLPKDVLFLRFFAEDAPVLEP